MEGHLLEQPDAAEPEVTQEGEPQVPSILAVINNHVIGGANVSLPAEDGSRLLKLISVNGATTIEASLSKELCSYLAESLVAVQVVEQGEEDDPDAEAGEPR
jgi:hypothetical protein